jgi:DNA-binding CsgD family transcriptional regulator
VGAKANAYLLKSDSTEQLIVTVRAAVLDPEGADAVVEMPPSMLEVTRKGDEGVLSARELEVLLLSARGLSNARIASSLYLAQGTVKRHLANVNEKMGVHSRGEATREALLKDWITIEEIREEEGAPRGGGRRGRGGLGPPLGSLLGAGARGYGLDLVHDREQVVHAGVLYLEGSVSHAHPRGHAVGVEHLHAAHHAPEQLLREGRPAVVAHEQVRPEAVRLPVEGGLGCQQDLCLGAVASHSEGQSLAVHPRLHGYKHAQDVGLLAVENRCGNASRVRSTTG